MIKSTVIFIVLLFPLSGFAQQDYIITKKGDTRTGKVNRGNQRGNRLTLKNADGKQKIHLREIKEWKNGNMPVVVVPHTKRKRTIWYELLLEVDGNKKLFRDLKYMFGDIGILHRTSRKIHSAYPRKYRQPANARIAEMPTLCPTIRIADRQSVRPRSRIPLLQSASPSLREEKSHNNNTIKALQYGRAFFVSL